MFGLPVETFLLLFGFPLVWIVYTIFFLHRTRDWDDDHDGDDS